MTRPESIENIFAAFVNQGTLEEAAAWMSSVARAHSGLHDEFKAALSGGIAAAERGDMSVVEAVNMSGYRVSTAAEAGEYCSELLVLYERAVDVQR